MGPKLVMRREERAVLEELRELEPIFHRPQYLDPRALERLVAEDFWEIGASGRRYSRAYVLKTLSARAAAKGVMDDWDTSDFHCRAIAPEVRAICARHGVPYRTDSWGKTLAKALRHLNKLWIAGGTRALVREAA